MNIDREFFLHVINHPSRKLVAHLDRVACGCKYIHHWIYNMDKGKWNPNLNEMDFELRDIKTPEQLFDFIKQKHDDFQKHQVQP